MIDVFGIQAARSVLRENPEKARCLYLQQGRRDARVNELISLARETGVRHQSVPAPWFKRRLGEVAHQGVVLECMPHTFASEAELLAALPEFGHHPLLLVLDEVTDPRNLGACLRSANAAGVHAVILPKRHSAPLTPSALKTAQGGVEGLMMVEVVNLARALKHLQQAGLWVVGTDADAPQNYSEIDAQCGLVLVMGSEDKGLRRLTKEGCDHLVSIPMYGSVSSLNVAVATGVVLFDIQQRRQVLATSPPPA